MHEVKSLLRFCLVLWLLIPGKARAEPHERRERFGQIEIGVSFAPGIIWYGGSEADTEYIASSRKLGFTVGTSATLGLSSWLSLESGLSFARKGAALELVASGKTGEVRTSYLVLPMLARIAPHQLRLAPVFVLGPQVGFMIDCEIELNDTGDCTDSSKVVDLGLVIGTGVNVTLPWSGVVRLDVRYEHGLIRADDSTEPNQDIKNRAVLFSIGYSHRLGGAEGR
jgi:hypothetical protein